MRTAKSPSNGSGGRQRLTTNPTLCLHATRSRDGSVLLRLDVVGHKGLKTIVALGAFAALTIALFLLRR